MNQNIIVAAPSTLAINCQCESDKYLNFTAPVPGEFIINEDISSPSQITASKKSSVWLHWNYTYGGDYLNAIMYSHQGITYKSRYGSTTIELARRKGQFSTIEKLSSIPDPIGTRIAVISDNSTLVVHNLQYNDSGSLFRSYVQVKNRLTALFLKPNVTLFVKGKLLHFCDSVLLSAPCLLLPIGTHYLSARRKTLSIPFVFFVFFFFYSSRSNKIPLLLIFITIFA